MTLSKEAQGIYDAISKEGTKLGDIRKVAKEIKRNHPLSMELWQTGDFNPRLLATLIMDKKLLTQDIIESLIGDLDIQDTKQRNQITDWLLANQFTKSKSISESMLTWESHELALLRRLFWYYQARLRWMGKTPPDNSQYLVELAEEKLENEVPEVQWAMNFCIGQIGIREEIYRNKCIALGERLGLYKDEPYTKGCTPNYLPEFIRIEVEKLTKK